MKKGQSFIIEFILFFMISFSLFVTIGYYFYSQNEYFKRRVGSDTAELINDLVSVDILRGLSCKGCDEVSIKEDIPSRIGGFYFRIELNEKGLNTSLYSGKGFSKQNPLFNLNESFSLSGSTTSENKIVGIKINNTGIGVE